MNGSEHFAEAERLLRQADHDVSENYVLQTGERKADVIAAAQVHATLALVAATLTSGDQNRRWWDADALSVSSES